MFSGGVERDHGMKWVKSCISYTVFHILYLKNYLNDKQAKYESYSLDYNFLVMQFPILTKFKNKLLKFWNSRQNQNI